MLNVFADEYRVIAWKTGGFAVALVNVGFDADRDEYPATVMNARTYQTVAEGEMVAAHRNALRRTPRVSLADV